MNNEFNNNVQMPETLAVMQAQNTLRQILQAYPLPAHIWHFIIKDLLNEVDDSYMAQLANDQDEYQKRMAEVNTTEETAPHEDDETAKE